MTDSDTYGPGTRHYHEMKQKRPEWWKKNQQLREELGLPDYEPARFDDGVFKHEILPDLENEYNCTITFQSKNPQYPCDWVIRIDGEQIMTIERRRTKCGNTIFQITSEKFVKIVVSHVDN